MSTSSASQAIASTTSNQLSIANSLRSDSSEPANHEDVESGVLSDAPTSLMDDDDDEEEESEYDEANEEEEGSERTSACSVLQICALVLLLLLVIVLAVLAIWQFGLKEQPFSFSGRDFIAALMPAPSPSTPALIVPSSLSTTPSSVDPPSSSSFTSSLSVPSSSSASSSSLASSALTDALIGIDYDLPSANGSAGISFLPVPEHKHRYEIKDVVSSLRSSIDFPLKYEMHFASRLLDCHAFYRGVPRFIGTPEDPVGRAICVATGQAQRNEWKCPAEGATNFTWKPAFRVAQPWWMTIEQPIVQRGDGSFAVQGHEEEAHYHLAPSCWYTNVGWSPNPTVVSDLSTAIVLSQFWSRAYFHMMVETLPRLLTLPVSLLLNSSIRMVLAKPAYPSQYELLRWLGWGDRLMFIEDGEAVNIARAIQPMPGQCKEANPKQLLAWRQFLFTHTWLSQLGPLTRGEPVDNAAEFKHIVWMSRKGSRSLSNEDELLAVLREAYPKAELVIHTSKMSMTDTARTMYKADLIIGPHGAGFVNTIFARVGTVLVEFIGSLYPNYIGYHMAWAYGMTHYTLVSQGTGEEAMTIKVEDFRLLLKEFEKTDVIEERRALRAKTDHHVECDTSLDMRK